MKVASKISKLFGVLVIGGSMMAHAAELPLNSSEEEEEKETCKLEIKQTDKTRFPAIKKMCLDGTEEGTTLGEIIFKLNDDGDCLTPFCGCWLG